MGGGAALANRVSFAQVVGVIYMAVGGAVGLASVIVSFVFLGSTDHPVLSRRELRDSAVVPWLVPVEDGAIVGVAMEI